MKKDKLTGDYLHIATDMSSPWYSKLQKLIGNNHNFIHLCKKYDKRQSSKKNIIPTKSSFISLELINIIFFAIRKRKKVVFHNIYPYFLLTYLFPFFSANFFFIIRSSDYKKIKNSLILKQALNHAPIKSKLAAKQVSLYNKFKKFLPKRIKTACFSLLHNPMNHAYLTANTWVRNSGNEKTINLFCPAFIHPQKNLLPVIRYANYLVTNKSFISCNVKFAGEVMDQKYFEKLKNICVDGVKLSIKKYPINEMIEEYLSTDYVIQMSDETYGLCFLEANCLGVPIIAKEEIGFYNNPPFHDLTSFSRGESPEEIFKAMKKSTALINADLAREYINKNDIGKNWRESFEQNLY